MTPGPQAPPGRAVDAIRAPIGHAGAGSSAERLARLVGEFAPLLGGGRIFVRHQGAEHFVTARPDDTLHHPRDDARSGTPRYHWEDRGDGVLYGTLDDGPSAR